MAVTQGLILKVAYFGDLSSKQGPMWCPGAGTMQKLLCYYLNSHPYATTSHLAKQLSSKPPDIEVSLAFRGNLGLFCDLYSFYVHTTW